MEALQKKSWNPENDLPPMQPPLRTLGLPQINPRVDITIIIIIIIIMFHMFPFNGHKVNIFGAHSTLCQRSRHGSGQGPAQGQISKKLGNREAVDGLHKCQKRCVSYIWPLIKRCLMILMLLDIGFGTVLANLDFSSKTIQHLYEIVSNVCLVLA